ncbi:hypothetical protein HJG60_010679 [Phyllostomus discolor]|uniref:Uncharacterized protein n=1 Tax=Phyllostomus discolor TaxID=89673 RepID=A0A834EBH7_9CHIR|nr:hypothetical protein HJG60_010679 [Phyllostomus discolor]
MYKRRKRQQRWCLQREKEKVRGSGGGFFHGRRSAAAVASSMGEGVWQPRWLFPRENIGSGVFHGRRCVAAEVAFSTGEDRQRRLPREKRKGGRTEGETHQCVVASRVPPAGDLVHNLCMCLEWELNQGPFGSQLCHLAHLTRRKLGSHIQPE